MQLNKKRHLSIEEKRQIYTIWNAVYPKQSLFKTFELFDDYISKMVDPTHYLLTCDQDKIAAWLVTLTRDGSRWLVILIHWDFQKQGLGSRLLHEMKKDESCVSAWITPHNNYFKGDGSIYQTPISFYEKNGFQVTSETFVKDDFSGTKVIWQR